MKLLLETLRQYCPSLPTHKMAIRALFDDSGIEVKDFVSVPQGSLLTVELLANRGDHHAYVGIARELAGKLQAPLITPPDETITITPQAAHKVSIETEHCFHYTLSAFHVADLAALTDQTILQTLSATDNVTGIATVDVANFVGLELGQPLHAFDADKITGNLIVRLSRAGETAQLLFTDAPQEIPADTLVICDDVNILALAGIMGCMAAAVTTDTTHILLESALFDPLCIRKQAKKLKLQTNASMRFERGGDFEMVIKGVERFKYLLTQIGGKQIGTTVSLRSKTFDLPVITLSLAEINHYLSLSLSAEEVKQRLEAYAFTVKTHSPSTDCLTVQVPSHRLWDVTSLYCLYEELAKSIGYNELPAALLPCEVGAALPAAYQRQKQVSERLVGLGFYEVIIDSFYGVSEVKQAFADLPLPSKHLSIINSLDKAFSLLKNNGILQALNLLAFNQRYGLYHLKIFEKTRLFFTDDQAFCREQGIVWGVINGLQAKQWHQPSALYDPWYVKGILEAIMTELNLTNEWQKGMSTHPMSAALHPKRQWTLCYRGKCVGIGGEIHPLLVTRFDLKYKKPLYFELNTALFEQTPTPCTAIKEPSDWLPMKRSLAFHVPLELETEQIMTAIRQTAPHWLQQVMVIDYYETKEQEASIRAFTFELIFENNNQRSADMINTTLTAIRETVLQQFASLGVCAR